MSDRIAEIEKRLSEATPNYRKAPILKSDWPDAFNEVANVRGVRIIGDYKSVSCGAEAEFIANAPADLRILLDEMRRLNAEIEQLRVQLAGCGVAAMSNTRETLARQAKIKPGDYGWSASYGDALKTVEREICLREERDQLKARIAELENVLIAIRSQMCWEADRDQLTNGFRDLHTDVTQALAGIG
jgi:hypothetical protein